MTEIGPFRFSPHRAQRLQALLRAEGIERAGRVTPRPDPAAPVPLTFSQSRLWFLNRFTAHQATFVIPMALTVHGSFRLDVFARACDEVVRRHESLRTVCYEIDGRPVQQVRPELRPDVRIVELRHLAPDAVPAELQRRAAELIDRPFDLGAGPLLRIDLLDLAPDAAAVLLVVHHIVADLWSTDVLMRELMECYAALLAGRPVGLADLAVQFPDFARWQQEAGGEAESAADLTYWRAQLAGIPLETDLPADHRRPQAKSFRGSSVPIELAPPLVRSLRQLAKAEGATVFMVLAAAISVLVARLGDNDDVVIGTPVANRPMAELEPLIGFFVNTLALRTDLTGNPSFRTVLRRMRRVCHDAYAHQSLPFERLVEELQPERSLSRTPLFQVMFAFRNLPLPDTAELGIEVDPVPLDSRKAEFDLLLDLLEDRDTIWGYLEYSLDLFEEETARRLVRILQRLVRSLVKDPDRPIGEPPLTGPDDRRRILASASVASPRPRGDAPGRAGAARERPTTGRGAEPAGVSAENALVVLDRFGQVAPVGVAGELHIAGEGPAAGQHDLPEPAARRVVSRPVDGVPVRMLATGDLARYRSDGTVELLGRLDRQVKLRGVRVDLDEVESALLEQERIHEAAVAVREPAAGDPRLVAYLVGDARPDPAELAARLRRLLPEHMIPATFVPLPALPRTPTGEVDRAALPEQGTDEPEPAEWWDEFVEPRDDLERGIARLWAGLLGVEEIGVYDDFFELGGHSMLATRLSAELATAYGIELPIRRLFENPTVADLAAWIGERQAEQEISAAVIPVIDRAGTVPLSFAQEHTCLHHPLHAEHPAHNVATGVLLRGPLDVTALRQSLTGIAARHEVLRTRITGRPPELTQQVTDDASWPLTVVDLRTTAGDTAAGDGRRHTLRRLAGDEATRPFRIGAEPLVRALLVRLPADEHALVLVMHHLVTDNWSYGVLVRELSELYSARTTGRAPVLPDLPIQYADFAAWQQRTLAAGGLDEHAAYWRRQLRDLPVLRLTAPPPPAARPEPMASPARHPVPPSGEAVTGSAQGFVLDASTTRALNELARQEGATLFMVLLAAYVVLLSAYSGSDDVPVDFPEAGRDRPETAELIGFFVNILMIRADLAGAPSFRDLVGQVRLATLDAYAHCGVPLYAFDGDPGGGLAGSRFRFNLLNASVPAVEMQGLTVETLDTGSEYAFSELLLADVAPAEVDLALIMREDGARLRGTWLYALDNLDAGALASMLRDWAPLLERITADPDGAVDLLLSSPGRSQ